MCVGVSVGIASSRSGQPGHTEGACSTDYDWWAWLAGRAGRPWLLTNHVLEKPADGETRRSTQLLQQHQWWQGGGEEQQQQRGGRAAQWQWRGQQQQQLTERVS